MTRNARLLRPWAAVAFLTLGLAACKGSTGPAGTAAVDTGTIAGTVKDAGGSPVAAATVSTDPSTVTVQTNATGAFTLTAIRIGAYTLVASKSGYVDGKLTGVGVGAGGTVNVTLVLSPVPATVGSLSGTIRGRKGTSGASSPVAGASVCVEGTSPLQCATSGIDGTYALSGVTPGFVFVSASATGFLPGETRRAAYVAAGSAATGLDVTLSGMPSASATYLGSSGCPGCHIGTSASLVSAWQGSAHVVAVARTANQVDVTGWPPAAADCVTPSTFDTGFTATDPNVSAAPLDREVFLVRYGATCTPAFAMALDTNGNGAVDAGDTIIPVTGSVGGVATDAGQCGNGGIIPANAPCAANLGGSGAVNAKGWWQQELLVDIGPGATKPSWVTWATTAGDMLVLPAAWNQRPNGGGWIPAPDYNPAPALAFSAACSGCHETGLSLAADVNGIVTTYSAAAQNIGCEKCHGPGSAHAAAGGDAQLIVNPAYLTAQSEREVCGQCHSQGVSSASPAGVFGFAWNDQAATNATTGGNFIPGVHVLSDFMSAPSSGDPAFYWPSGFPSVDHLTYQDLEGNVHANNSYERLTCGNCHASHGGAGGPFQFQRTNQQTGAQYVFQNNDAVLRNDVLCLACHLGSFAQITLDDVANYHISTGGKVLAGGTPLAPAADAQASSTALVAAAVNAHMIALAGMPAYFDPTGAVSGMPVGRCSSCHMPKTTFTGAFFPGTDPRGKTANVIGDVSAHTFKVAWPDMSIATLGAATSWDTVMPNACGSCHPVYLVGF